MFSSLDPGVLLRHSLYKTINGKRTDNYAGSSTALMNGAVAVAGIMSPVVFGWILTRTGSSTTPFAFSVGLLLFAIVMTDWIRPDRPIAAVPGIGGLAVAGE